MTKKDIVKELAKQSYHTHYLGWDCEDNYRQYEVQDVVLAILDHLKMRPTDIQRRVELVKDE